MKHRMIVAIGCLLCSGALQAQSLKDLFVHMPDTLSLVMSDVNRADCVDFLASNMKAQVTNRFNHTSEVKVLTDDYLQAQVTKSSVWEMRRLPLRDSVSMICVVKTVKAPVEDSHVRFYSSDWQELPVEDFLPELPSADAFFQTPSPEKADSLNELRLKADITFLKASLSPTDNTLTFIYTTPEYLNHEDREKIKLYMKPSPVVYEWKGGKFVLKEGA